ncbi:MAG: ribosome assembly RNA-binding protein YhbY [bacterium]|nr:ribosome assembly RNA-binding protein YhbY [bacterium]
MLTSAERKELKAIAHHLQPVVTVGKNGITSGVVAETDSALTIHELIKVKFAGSKEGKRELGPQLAEAVTAEIVTLVGNVLILYRPEKDEKAK